MLRFFEYHYYLNEKDDLQFSEVVSCELWL